MSKQQRTTYCTTKLKIAAKSLATCFADAACVDTENIVQVDEATKKCNAFSKTSLNFRKNYWLNSIFWKLHIQRKCKFLPSSLHHGPQRKLCAISIVLNKAAQVKKEQGVLALPVRKKQDGISEDTKAKVLTLYEDDEYSRMLPGTKDKVGIKKKYLPAKEAALV